MKLTDELSRKAIAWLNANWQGDRACPVCHHNNWTVNPHVFEFRPYEKGALVVGGLVYPVVLVICNHCGSTLMFSAMRMGLLQDGEPESEEKEGGQ